MLIRRLLTLLLFTLAVAIAAWWFLQLRAPAPVIAPATISLPAAPAIDTPTQGRLFGERTLTASNVNVTVKGVMAAISDKAPGMAILSIDEAPARAYSTGQFIARGTQLIEIRTDRVVLDQGGARVELSVPQPKPLATSGLQIKQAPAVQPALPPRDPVEQRSRSARRAPPASTPAP